LHIQKWNIPLNEFFQNTEIENFYTIILKSAAGRIWPAGRSLPITGLCYRADFREKLLHRTKLWCVRGEGGIKSLCLYKWKYGLNWKYHSKFTRYPDIQMYQSQTNRLTFINYCTVRTLSCGMFNFCLWN